MATIRCPLYEAFEVSKQEPVFIDENRAFLYHDLEMQVRGLTALLLELEIGPGMPVGICMPNSTSYVALAFALFRVGAIAVPLSTRLPDAALEEQLQQTGVSQLFLSRLSGERYLDGVREHLVEDLIESIEKTPPTIEAPRYDLKQPATIFFTSGSSGQAKPVLHGIGAHYYSALGSNVNLHLTTGDRWMLSLPLYHVGGFGIVFRCMLSGASMILPRQGEDLAEEAQLYRATHLSAVPTQLMRLLDAPGAEDLVKQLKAVLVGGAPCAPALIDEAIQNRFPVHTTYGLTEMASQVTTTPPAVPLEARHSAGGVLKYRELMLAEDGEILVRGDTLCEGVVIDGRPVKLLDEDGWYATGDLGEERDGGWLFVKGRKDNQFISGGENIHPEEIEQVMLDSLELERVVVVPVPDPEFGFRPVAFVDEDCDEDEEQMRTRLEEFLPRFKIPDAIYALPPDAAEGMKVDRLRLRELALELS